MNDSAIRKRIIDKINETTNILVTVSNNPSVDELASALGLAMYLNKIDKHATAVFSGKTPPAIKFLKPKTVFEQSPDSLRDFIIALDKEKADHLRYKVEGDVVKIFITPYRTDISQKDLEFSQGDYNVELVIAVGVKSEKDLDKALSSHGKILHDAAVVSLSVKGEASSLGNIHWEDSETHSYGELVMSLIDGMKNNKAKVDEQIANAILTGIVSATDRFSNENTSSKSMSVAAQLMAVGANQQLIVAHLEKSGAVVDDSGARAMSDGDSNQIRGTSPSRSDDSKSIHDELGVEHKKDASIDEVASAVTKAKQDEAAKKAEQLISQATEDVQSKTISEDSGVGDKDTSDTPHEFEQQFEQQLKTVAPQASVPDLEISEQLAPLEVDIENQEKETAAQMNNQTIVTHDDHHTPLPKQPDAVVNNSSEQISGAEALAESEAHQDDFHLEADHHKVIQPPQHNDNQQIVNDAQDALDDVHKAFESLDVPNTQGVEPSLATNQQPSVVDTTQTVPVGPTPTASQANPSMPPLPPPPPMPDFSTLPPLPSAPVEGTVPQQQTAAPTVTPTQQPVANEPFDPAKFQIPG